MKFERINVIVLDSVGIGALPDAPSFGDEGSNTLGHIGERVPSMKLPNLTQLGLGNIAPLPTVPAVDKPKAYYGKMAEVIDALAKQQPGFLRVESVREEEGKGITVSYWESLEAIQAWKANAKHLTAQQLGKEKWYTHYQVEICQVMKEYSF